ncbi:MAG: hypothetical protein H6673_14070 [Anaerolineales bacterium]|nr:hypothetical protein [Anaerolineales bacterium]
MGDNIPDFNSMSLDEQMRWLESLAARQGASADEFTTSADMDVPEIDPDSVVIDEPGYVPSETFSFSKHAQPTPPPAQPTPPVEQPAWDGQATEQYATYDVTQQQAEQPMAETPTSGYDNMIGDDPMAFLESLARRQGADPSEFTTAASMEIPEIDPDSVVIDEPGYVPSETFSFSKHAQPPQPPAQEPSAWEPTPEPEVASTEWPVQETYQEWQEPVAETPAGGYDNMIGDDPMAFLESLARRQGADPSEFTTAASMEIPEIDPDSVVIDEPGYVPSETFSFSKHAQPPQPPAQEPPAYEPAPEPEATPTEWPQQQADWYSQQGEYAQGDYAQSDYTYEQPADQQAYTYDEAAWQQQADAGTWQPTDDASTWQYDYSDQTAWQGDYSYEQPADQQQYQYDDASAYGYQQEEEPTPYRDLSDPELMAESDPMKWLESLALRNGANAEELITAADMDIPELDPTTTDMSNVGPGYTPYSPFETTPGYTQQEPPPPPPSVPEIPSIPELDMALEARSEEAMPEAPAEEESLSWLQDLALDQGADATDFLAEFEPEALPGFDLDFDTSDEEATAAIAAMIEEPQASYTDEALSGMTDEDIARAQIEGTITPEQELAWLMQKAHQLEELHETDVEEEVLPTGEAVPADIPDWVMAQMSGTDDLNAFAPEGDLPLNLDDILLSQEEAVTDWLSEEAEGSLDIPEITLEDTSAFEATGSLLAGYDESHDPWVEALAAEASGALDASAEPDWYKQALQQAEELGEPDFTSEVEEFEDLEPEVAEDPDPTAWYLKAIDEEPATEGTELPDWLRMSVSDDDAGGAIGDWLREQELGEGTPEATDWQTAATDDVPAMSWLDDVVEAEEPTPIPDTPAPLPTPIVVPPVAPPKPVGEILPQGVEGALPTWHPSQQQRQPVRPAEHQPIAPPPPPVHKEKVAAPPPLPTREPVRRVSQPVPPPPPPPPVPAQFAEHKARLEQNPDDHDTRLRLARELGTHGSTGDSLKQYEALVENSAMLDTVSTDLVALASNLPDHPKVRRLLGDVYMRQGRLQEALDTYRGALNQL